MAESAKEGTVSLEYALKNLCTPNGKEISINHVRGSNMYSLSFVGGGEAPPDFDSLFTSRIEAATRAQAYILKKFKELETKSKPTKVLG